MGGGGEVRTARRRGGRCQEGGCEEGADVLDERVGCFQRGEVAAGVEVGPVDDVASLLGVPADGYVLGEDGHPGGHGSGGGTVAA